METRKLCNDIITSGYNQHACLQLKCKQTKKNQCNDRVSALSIISISIVIVKSVGQDCIQLIQTSQEYKSLHHWRPLATVRTVWTFAFGWIKNFILRVLANPSGHFCYRSKLLPCNKCRCDSNRRGHLRVYIFVGREWCFGCWRKRRVYARGKNSVNTHEGLSLSQR